MDPDWQEDLKRAGGSAWLLWREQGLWALALYRYGRRVDRMPKGIARRIHNRLYWLCYRVVETLTGIGLPKAATVGGGLRIWHFGGIFIHPRVVMGRNCTLRQGVTIGDKGDNGAVPTIGQGVDFGAYAQVLGPVHVGDGAVIGAMAVVVKDVPAGATVVGNPARIIRLSGREVDHAGA
ncbi:MAG TPA: serine acetyltransferase [Limnobacter sp.]|uniref:serine O-acetyltransferase n=1 Tax=Limnobacter sp. TaxID=2003368 RepID=UPI002ED924CC